MRTVKPVVRREVGHAELRDRVSPRQRDQALVRLRHLVIRSFNFSGRALPGLELYNSILVQCDFREALLSGGMFGELQAEDSDFRCAFMEDLDIVWSVLSRSRFDHARLVRACFFKTELASASFREADLTGATFTQCDLSHADFTGAILNATRFDDCRYSGAQGISARQLSYEPAMFSEHYWA